MRKFLQTLGAAIVAACGSVGAQASTGDSNSVGYTQIKKPFSAYLVIENVRSDFKIRQSVALSPLGVRLKASGMFGGEEEGIFITHFASEQSWVVDVSRKIFAVLDNDEQAEQSNEERPSGIMGTQPCSGLQSERGVATKRLLASGVYYHECLHAGGLVKQHYDEGYGVVIKEEHLNGDVYQLTNVRPASFEEEFFLPPSEYKEVSLPEFFIGLSSYEGSTDNKY